VTAAFQTKRLPEAVDVIAPDGAEVRILLQLEGGSMAHFQIGAGETSAAVRHRTVEEIWYCVGGTGEMWRRHGGDESVVSLAPGICLTIPVGTEFQFRATGDEPLKAIGMTMPPWPGAGEVVTIDGPWPPTVERGPL
jgi:mannose-6-phosphate isomerase-like protein (cupin superfamily)